MSDKSKRGTHIKLIQDSTSTPGFPSRQPFWMAGAGSLSLKTLFPNLVLGFLECLLEAKLYTGSRLLARQKLQSIVINMMLF